jgi:hypothetical protein
MRATAPLSFAIVMLGLAASSAAQPADELAANTRVAALVPAEMSTRDACAGFGSLQECSAVLHAAQNLNIPFARLRERVIGGVSLQGAIHSLRPRADSRREVRRAEAQASEDMRPIG